MNKSVLVVVITKDYVKKECYESILAQDYQDFETIIRIEKPKYSNPDSIIQTYLNCSSNREGARKLALASDCDKFLFVDSDMVLPRDTITKLIKQNKDVIGGWYKIRNDVRWVGGKWVADNVFINFKTPDVSVIKTDMVGLGCALISRKVLEQIKFRSGTNETSKDECGRDILHGECLAFGNDVTDLGFDMYLDGDVICENLG